MTLHSEKKKICVVTTDRADYGRLKPVMEAIREHPELELQIVAGSSLFLDHFFWYLRHGEPVSFLKSIRWYLRARKTVRFGSQEEIQNLQALTSLLTRDGFTVTARLPMFLEGGNNRIMVKIMGLGLLGITDIFEKLRPDVVLLHGDRFEILSVAAAAAFLNIPVAHIEGGDVSGTIDNSVRHAITKLAHLHFPVTEKSRERLIRMGEHPENIFRSGSPIIDFLKDSDTTLGNWIYEVYGPGRGLAIDVTKPFLLVSHHPVTTESTQAYEHMKEIIAVVDDLKFPTLFLASNIDAGSDGMAQAIREYAESNPASTVFFKYFSPADYARILANAAVAVGNSSSFIREGAYFGTPAVLVGNRQSARERGRNVIEVEADRIQIRDAIRQQLEYGRYDSDTLFGDGTASQIIADTLAGLDLKNLSLQKTFYEE